MVTKKMNLVFINDENKKSASRVYEFKDNKYEISPEEVDGINKELDLKSTKNSSPEFIIRSVVAYPSMREYDFETELNEGGTVTIECNESNK